MAKYNRDYLVPYLEDVCALYMCEEILLVRAFGVQKQIVNAEVGKIIDPPAYPNYEGKWTDANIGGIFGSALFIIGALFIMFLVPWAVITVICLGTIALFGWLLISTIRNIKRISDENTFREFRYNSEYAQYIKKKKEIDAQNEINRQKVPKLRDEFVRYNTDIKKCQEVLNQVYQANVLPMQYRNKYVAMYLYDYFKYSRLDDLDAAINTCVLEQIKDKLEEMIEMQAQTIVNQRIMIANQRMAIEEQREYATYMKQKVKMITDNIEEQNLYLSMIESNTAATAFFAAADYLRS